MYVCKGNETWTGHPGPYSEAYAEFTAEGYAGPITVTHPNGQSKIIVVEAICAPEGSGLGPCDQEVEAAVRVALGELGTLPALWDWKKYLPYIAIGGIGIVILWVALKKK